MSTLLRKLDHWPVLIGLMHLGQLQMPMTAPFRQDIQHAWLQDAVRMAEVKSHDRQARKAAKGAGGMHAKCLNHCLCESYARNSDDCVE